MTQRETRRVSWKHGLLGVNSLFEIDFDNTMGTFLWIGEGERDTTTDSTKLTFSKLRLLSLAALKTNTL